MCKLPSTTTTAVVTRVLLVEDTLTTTLPIENDNNNEQQWMMPSPNLLAGGKKQRPGLVENNSNVSSSCCSETEIETATLVSTRSSSSSSSCISSEEDDNNCIHLTTNARRSKVTQQPPPTLLNFASELEQARNNENPSQTTCLELCNFIERSTRHDIYALRDLLIESTEQQRRRWKTVRLVDTAYATNFRRFAYKKENISHHIQKLCLANDITLDYQIHLEIDVDDLSLESTLALIQEVKKHPEVRHLEVNGHLNHLQEQAVLKAITSLLRMDDRDWETVNVYTGFCSCSSSNNEEDYENWRSTMEHYMGVFSQLYEHHNIPIDIRPCTVH